MNNAALGGIKNAKCERPSILADLVARKSSHCMQFRFTSLPKAVCVDDKSMFAFQFAAVSLEKDDLKCIEHLAIFG